MRLRLRLRLELDAKLAGCAGTKTAPRATCWPAGESGEKSNKLALIWPPAEQSHSTTWGRINHLRPAFEMEMSCEIY